MCVHVTRPQYSQNRDQNGFLRLLTGEVICGCFLSKHPMLCVYVGSSRAGTSSSPGALRDGTSLTPTAESKLGRPNVSQPAHHCCCLESAEQNEAYTHMQFKRVKKSVDEQTGWHRVCVCGS